jgi:hypothetical protein
VLPNRPFRHALSAAGMAAVVASCVVVPQTREVYDPDCQTHGKQIVLEAAVLGGFYGCVGEGCAAMMATMGIVTAASVVISGSIAVVGNVLYWAEKQGRCTRPASSSAAAPASAPK